MTKVIFEFMYIAHNQLYKYYLESFKIISSILRNKCYVNMYYLLQTKFVSFS